MYTLFAACSIPATAEFLNEYRELCKKHKMALVPTEDQEADFHHNMRCIPIDGKVEAFLNRTTVKVEDFNPVLELYRL